MSLYTQRLPKLLWQLSEMCPTLLAEMCTGKVVRILAACHAMHHNIA